MTRPARIFSQAVCVLSSRWSEELARRGSGRRGGATRQEAEPPLIARARHVRAAFAALYDLCVARVYAFCAVHSASTEEAEDLTTQTFEQALRAIGRYEERGQPFSAWLPRIVANAAAHRARRPAAVPLHRTGATDADEATAGDTPAESWVADWERADWIEEHLAALPTDQRRMVRLRCYDDLGFGDVATAMNRSAGAVKQLPRRTLTAPPR